MSTEHIAHAVCPYCYPEPDKIAEGTPVTRWCGEVVPLNHAPVNSSARFCAACEDGRECPTCGAVSTFLGILPPQPKENT